VRHTSEITAFARKWLCTDVQRWYKVILSAPNESTRNVVVIDARGVLVHSISSFSVFWKWLTRCVWDSISICEWATPGKSDVYFSSHTCLFYNLFWWVSYIYVDYDSYIEVFLWIKQCYIITLQRNMSFNNMQ